MYYLVLVLNIACTINEGYWLFSLIDGLFPLRRSNKASRMVLGKSISFWGSVLSFSVLILVMNSIEKTSVLTALAGIALALVLSIVFWENDIVTSSGTVGVYFLGLLSFNLVQTVVLGTVGGETLLQSAMTENGVARLFVLISALVLWTLLNRYIDKKIDKLQIDRNGIKYLTTVSAVGFVGLMYIFIQMANSFSIHLTLTLITMFVGLSALVVVLYFVIKYKQLQQRMNILHEESKLMKESFERVQEYYEANSKLYHDMDSHMRSIQMMLENSDIGCEELRQYVDALVKPIDEYKKEVFTGNKVLDLIIGDNKVLAEVKGVKFTVVADRLPSNLKFENSDLCTLFSNMMKNALEAVRSEIAVKICIMKGYLYFEVDNDFVKEPRIVDGKYVTHKQDKFGHGWGIQNMDEIVAKYNGSIKRDVTRERFLTVAMLSCEN